MGTTGGVVIGGGAVGTVHTGFRIGAGCSVVFREICGFEMIACGLVGAINSRRLADLHFLFDVACEMSYTRRDNLLRNPLGACLR